MTTNDEVRLPAWLVRLMVLSMEKAYRRGFQHGMVQPHQSWSRSLGRSADMKVANWRFSLRPKSDPRKINQGTPYQPSVESIIVRHLRSVFDDGLGAGFLPRTYLHECDNGDAVIRRTDEI